ncbi:flavin-containing monooxygenase 5-like [Lineus longissimus]|uniref:flavin-containing monooxygenase 5-like n=1 Tax=Lineus longissimus TaxID=88925 RepID=UPI002B4D7C37
MVKKIAIIGAGCSGLAAIKCCLDEGLRPVCFERYDDIGGLWKYSEQTTPDKGSIYRSCVINTSKEMMAFSDFPVPKEFPPFMPHHFVFKYFKLYAEHFGLLPYIRFQTSVESVKPAADYQDTGRWEVYTKATGDVEATSQPQIFDGVLICTGHHCHPYRPNFPGLNKFRGTQMHSHDYKRPEIFEDKKVLVIGIGNSAVDIAVDTSRLSSQTFVSTRRGAWIVNRMGPWGIPADALANSRFMFSLPQQWLQWTVEKLSNYRFDHDTYGVQPLHRALEAHPTINDELPQRIMTGSVKVKPNVKTFTEDGVIFEDGTFEQLDAIILATGYNYQFKFVEESVLKVDNNDASLYKYTFPPNLKHPTLGVVGLVQAIGAVMPISEMQCRWFMKVVKGERRLPSLEDMTLDITAKKADMANQYVKSQRHTLQTFWIDFMDQLADEIGVKPDLRKLFWEDPLFAMRCFFGPCIPAQYRLHGPGNWQGARSAICSAFSNFAYATKTRKVETHDTTWEMVSRYLVRLIFVVIGIVIFASIVGLV